MIGCLFSCDPSKQIWSIMFGQEVPNQLEPLWLILPTLTIIQTEKQQSVLPYQGVAHYKKIVYLSKWVIIWLHEVTFVDCVCVRGGDAVLADLLLTRRWWSWSALLTLLTCEEWHSEEEQHFGRGLGSGPRQIHYRNGISYSSTYPMTWWNSVNPQGIDSIDRFSLVMCRSYWQYGKRGGMSDYGSDILTFELYVRAIRDSDPHIRFLTTGPPQFQNTNVNTASDSSILARCVLWARANAYRLLRTPHIHIFNHP